MAGRNINTPKTDICGCVIGIDMAKHIPYWTSFEEGFHDFAASHNTEQIEIVEVDENHLCARLVLSFQIEPDVTSAQVKAHLDKVLEQFFMLNTTKPTRIRTRP
jgi:hypothetical protein